LTEVVPSSAPSCVQGETDEVTLFLAASMSGVEADEVALLPTLL